LRNRFLHVLFLLIIGLNSLAQNNNLPQMTADRPGMATTADIVIPWTLQAESGSSFERSGSGTLRQDYILYNTSLLRFGFNKNAELRLQTDFARLKTDSADIMGLDPIVLGTKLLLTRGNWIIPKTSVLMNVTLPWIGKKDFRPSGLLPSFYLLMQKDITKNLGICCNLGAQYDDFSKVPVEFFALCVTYGFTDKFSAYVENYDYFFSGVKPVNSIDVGCAYQFMDNLQFDVSGNMNLQDFSHYFMINGGVAWRIIRRTVANHKLHKKEPLR